MSCLLIPKKGTTDSHCFETPTKVCFTSQFLAFQSISYWHFSSNHQFPFGLIAFAKKSDVAIGIQRSSIDIVTLLAHEALLVPFRTLIRPHCKYIYLVPQYSPIYILHSLVTSSNIFLPNSYLPSKHFHIFFDLERPTQTRTLASSSTQYILRIVHSSLKIFELCFLLAKEAQPVWLTT